MKKLLFAAGVAMAAALGAIAGLKLVADTMFSEVILLADGDPDFDLDDEELDALMKECEACDNEDCPCHGGKCEPEEAKKADKGEEKTEEKVEKEEA